MKCDNCGADLTDEWITIRATWDGNTETMEVDCPECGHTFQQRNDKPEG